MFGGLAIGFAELIRPKGLAQGVPRDSGKRRRRREVRRPARPRG